MAEQQPLLHCHIVASASVALSLPGCLVRPLQQLQLPAIIADRHVACLIVA
jgi:hypothetical protein